MSAPISTAVIVGMIVPQGVTQTPKQIRLDKDKGDPIHSINEAIREAACARVDDMSSVYKAKCVYRQ